MKGKAKDRDLTELNRLNEELRIHQVELEHQNRELREAQQRIEESRDRYADLYDFAPVGYVDLDGKGLIRNINLTGAAMLRDAHVRLVGNPFTRFVAPGDRRKFLGHLKECLGASGRVTAGINVWPKDGPPFPAELQSVAARDTERGTIACRTAITDISERRLAEESLRESEERFRSLVKDALVGFFIVQGGKIAFLNAEQERIFGSLPQPLKVEEFTGIHPEDREKFIALCGEEASAGSERTPMDLRILHPGPDRGQGKVRWAHCRASLISWRGQAARLVNMLDVTRTRELERIAQDREKMAALGHVAVGIAHEVRNPLSGFNIYIASLEDSFHCMTGLEPHEKERIGECLRSMKTASDKIASVIERVLGFTRPITLSLKTANVNVAIEDAAALARVTLRAHGVKLKISLSGDLPKCRIDPGLFEQVVLNLITNADQAMERTQGPKTIEISSAVERERIVIRVSDTGPGIPQTISGKIFDPFYTTRKDGYGIGLSFCRRVIEDHAGSLTVAGGGSGGAEFLIALPIPMDRSAE